MVYLFSIKSDKSLSPAVVSSVEVLILVVQLLVQKLGLNSENSSIPPSKGGGKKPSTRKKSDKPSCGQPGHKGETLIQVEDPDEIIEIDIDQRTLPNRDDLEPAGYESRQVVDIVMETVVREYRAEVMTDSSGNRYVATFPEHVTKSIQYGLQLKAFRPICPSIS